MLKVVLRPSDSTIPDGLKEDKCATSLAPNFSCADGVLCDQIE